MITLWLSLHEVIEIGNNPQRCSSTVFKSEFLQVDSTNGCLGYKPGSHKSGLQPHQPTNTLGFSQVLLPSKKYEKCPPPPSLNAKSLQTHSHRCFFDPKRFETSPRSTLRCKIFEFSTYFHAPIIGTQLKKRQEKVVLVYIL